VRAPLEGLGAAGPRSLGKGRGAGPLGRELRAGKRKATKPPSEKHSLPPHPPRIPCTPSRAPAAAARQVFAVDPGDGGSGADTFAVENGRQVVVDRCYFTGAGADGVDVKGTEVGAGRGGGACVSL
jgi:hypothetical protein